jgi:hypothetical protein
MAQHDPAVAYSKKLCEESKALRNDSKVAVADAKKAIARSRRLHVYIASRRKLPKR